MKPNECMSPDEFSEYQNKLINELLKLKDALPPSAIQEKEALNFLETLNALGKSLKELPKSKTDKKFSHNDK